MLKKIDGNGVHTPVATNMAARPAFLREGGGGEEAHEEVFPDCRPQLRRAMLLVEPHLLAMGMAAARCQVPGLPQGVPLKRIEACNKAVAWWGPAAWSTECRLAANVVAYGMASNNGASGPCRM